MFKDECALTVLVELSSRLRSTAWLSLLRNKYLLIGVQENNLFLSLLAFI